MSWSFWHGTWTYALEKTTSPTRSSNFWVHPIFKNSKSSKQDIQWDNAMSWGSGTSAWSCDLLRKLWCLGIGDGAYRNIIGKILNFKTLRFLMTIHYWKRHFQAVLLLLQILRPPWPRSSNAFGGLKQNGARSCKRCRGQLQCGTSFLTYKSFSVYNFTTWFHVWAWCLVV